MKKKVTLIGCGGWGTKIARKLAERDDIRIVLLDDCKPRVKELAEDLGVEYSPNVHDYLLTTGTQNGSLYGGYVIVATPPTERLQIIENVFNGYGRKPDALRVEKPLALTATDAKIIHSKCAHHGTMLTTGYTLLHDAMYEHVFSLIEQWKQNVWMVRGIRTGLPARHKIAPLFDIGCHVAAFATYFDAACSIEAQYDDETNCRITEFYFDDGTMLSVDEINKTVTYENVCDEFTAKYDALERDLDAWLNDSHRARDLFGVRVNETIGRILAS